MYSLNYADREPIPLELPVFAEMPMPLTSLRFPGRTATGLLPAANRRRSPQCSLCTAA